MLKFWEKFQIFDIFNKIRMKHDCIVLLGDFSKYKVIFYLKLDGKFQNFGKNDKFPLIL